MLRRQHAVYQDEALLIQTTRQATEELKSLFESDALESNRGRPKSMETS